MHINKQIRFNIKNLLQGLLFSSLLFLGGCSAAFQSISDIFDVKKENCWPCTMYKAVWEATGLMVTVSFPQMCSNALVLLGIGVLFWITFTVGKLIATVKEPNLKDFIGNMAMILFKAMCVAAVLYSSSFTIYILDLIVTPTISAFVDLTRAVMFSNSTIAKNLAAASISMGDIVSQSNIFTSDLGNQVQDLVYRIYLGFHSGMGLGGRMLVSPDPVMVTLGVAVIFMFFFLMLTIPLLFIEAFVFLGVVIVLFPYLLVAYVFPFCKPFIKNAWNVVFVCMAQIVLTGVFMAIMITVVKNYSNSVFSITKQFSDPVLIFGLKNMKDDALAFFALVYIMYKMTAEIPSISARLIGDFNRSRMSMAIQQSMNIGKNLGLMLGGIALTGTAATGAAGLAVLNQASDQLKGVVRSGNTNEIASMGTSSGDGGNSNKDAEMSSVANQKPNNR